MTEISAWYTQDGEWLELKTASSCGAAVLYEPAENDAISVAEPEATPQEAISFDAANGTIIALDLSRGWTPTSSAAGTFRMYAPADRQLEDWGLVLQGLPRIHGRLNEQGAINLFGEDALGMLHAIYAATICRRESIGDLRALQSATLNS